MFEDLERKSDSLLEKLAILQEDSEENKNRSEEEIQRLRRVIGETEDELNVIKKKGISIKVIDSHIVKMQKERNIAKHPTVKPVKYPGQRVSSHMTMQKVKSSSELAKIEKNTQRTSQDLLLVFFIIISYLKSACSPQKDQLFHKKEDRFI